MSAEKPPIQLDSRRGYVAKPFRARTVYGDFQVSGTLCGHIDVAVPQGKTIVLTPDEAEALIHALTAARRDVLDNSRPFDDPRLVDERPSVSAKPFRVVRSEEPKAETMSPSRKAVYDHLLSQDKWCSRTDIASATKIYVGAVTAALSWLARQQLVEISQVNRDIMSFRIVKGTREKWQS